MTQVPPATSPRQESPLRVLHLTLGADAGGLSRYITTLGAAMAERGVEVTAAGDHGAWGWAFEAAPFLYIHIPLKGGMSGMARSTRQLRQWLAEHPVDLIHTHYRRATFLGRRLQRSGKWDGYDERLGGPPRINTGGSFRYPPILYTLHLSHIDIRGWRRWFSDFGDHTHVASQDALHWLRDEAGVPPERITLIPHGVPVEQFPQRTEADRLTARAKLGLPPEVPVAAYVGRLDDPKNAAWCLDVVSAAEQAVTGMHLLLAGEGPHEAPLREQAKRSGIAGRVHFLGHTEPLPVYQASDLLLLPSAREGFSLVCAEAMSVGVPHVRTRTSGTFELTIESETGVSVEIDRRAFIGAVLRLLAQPAELRRMGGNGALLIREKYTFERQVEETLALYRRLVAGRQ